jgi:hypothetical protein
VSGELGVPGDLAVDLARRRLLLLPNGGDAGLRETTLDADVSPPMADVVSVKVLELSDSLVSHDFFLKDI